MPEGPHQTADFSASFPPSFAMMSAARRSFADWIATWHHQGVDEEFRADLLVVFSELLANAITGSAQPADHIDVRGCLHADALTLEVTNTISKPFTAVNLWAEGDPLRPDGRGLPLITALMDEFELTTHTDPAAIVARCRRRLPRPLPGASDRPR